MNDASQYQSVIDKADELNQIINSHEITLRYKNALSLIKTDSSAQEIYGRLVNLGKVLAEVKDSGKELGDDFVRENESLSVDLANNPIVKEFVEAQKSYFEMMAAVQKKISIEK
jgi:cell fate (sporulation/competence/biofilm development) regulator YlbF (YheA/YmcA/DUF963 family)